MPYETTLGSPRVAARVVLYWLPLGAGGRSVRWNGRIFEALVAYQQGRPRRDLYHSALEVFVDGDRYAIEMGPAWRAAGTDRGVVQVGPVASAWLGRSVVFRYEVRCWRNGAIPDVGEAVGGPRAVSDDPQRARRLLELVAQVPAVTWGRDELNTGEMWNSNSVVSWLLASSTDRMGPVEPPRNGRAPGWDAGLVLAARQRAEHHLDIPRRDYGPGR